MNTCLHSRAARTAMLRSRGFTLIELIAAVCILAVVALIALPSYATASCKARRSEGKILLQTVLAAEERYYFSFNRYTSDGAAAGFAIGTASQPGGYYALASLNVSADGQSVSARVDPQGNQQGDGCGGLTLDSAGRRGATGASAAECW